jgi:predicted ATPase
MLTRLKIGGFKNLVNVDVRFGPFTCIAGANGVGKSNLFDAIQFLAALTEKPLLDAAQSVRSADARHGDFRSIFHHVGETLGKTISFEVEILIPSSGRDDLGQPATAKTTFVRYTLVLQRREEEDDLGPGLAIQKEELVSIKRSEMAEHLPFRPNRSWMDSVVHGRRAGPYISTSGNQIIKLHGDGGRTGRARELPASQLVRTVLSSVNAAESPTALLARREMQSWRLLQLEPSALRAPDEYVGPNHLGFNGAHAPATLARLAKFKRPADLKNERAQRVFARIANRLSELVPGIRSIELDPDERRQILSIIVTDASRTRHTARVLSDGTLRFLALSILEHDPEFQGLLCLEEPENGIHPQRIEPMLKLLKDIAVSTDDVVDANNPMRQVIINTHSPSIVALVDADDLIFASGSPVALDAGASPGVLFTFLSETWRSQAQPEARTLSKSNLLAYLNPLGARHPEGTGRTRVKDRVDLQMLLPFSYPTSSVVHDGE